MKKEREGWDMRPHRAGLIYNVTDSQCAVDQMVDPAANVLLYVHSTGIQGRRVTQVEWKVAAATATWVKPNAAREERNFEQPDAHKHAITTDITRPLPKPREDANNKPPQHVKRSKQ